MEAKFSKVGVGIFLSVSTTIIISFCIWFFSNTLFTKYIEYKVIFPDSIAGLYIGSSVTYNGVQVGNVSDVAIKEKFDNKVVATLKINDQIKVKEDTFATLNMKGITGQMLVELQGGSSESAILKADKNNDLIIHYKESVFNQLTNAAPILLEKISQLLEKMEKLVSGKNKENFDELVNNITIISKETAKLPIVLTRTLNKVNTLIDQTKPILAETQKGLMGLPNMLTKAFEPIEPIIADLKNIAKNVNQFTDKINNQGITAIVSSSRSL